MKIRLMGTREECEKYIQSLNRDCIIEISDWYPNRGTSKMGRVYIEADALLVKVIPQHQERH